jgi:hypothetical protein
VLEILLEISGVSAVLHTMTKKENPETFEFQGFFFGVSGDFRYLQLTYYYDTVKPRNIKYQMTLATN